jgi:hypothetical protein
MVQLLKIVEVSVRQLVARSARGVHRRGRALTARIAIVRSRLIFLTLARNEQSRRAVQKSPIATHKSGLAVFTSHQFSFHSYRNAVIGSTRIARRAGM